MQIFLYYSRCRHNYRQYASFISLRKQLKNKISIKVKQTSGAFEKNNIIELSDLMNFLQSKMLMDSGVFTQLSLLITVSSFAQSMIADICMFSSTRCPNVRSTAIFWFTIWDRNFPFRDKFSWDFRIEGYWT